MKISIENKSTSGVEAWFTLSLRSDRGCGQRGEAGGEAGGGQLAHLAEARGVNAIYGQFPSSQRVLEI